MSPVEVFATENKIFDWQKVCLMVPSKGLDRCFFQEHSWSFDFYISEVTLIPWSTFKKDFDRLI